MVARPLGAALRCAADHGSSGDLRFIRPTGTASWRLLTRLARRPTGPRKFSIHLSIYRVMLNETR